MQTVPESVHCSVNHANVLLIWLKIFQVITYSQHTYSQGVFDGFDETPTISRNQEM